MAQAENIGGPENDANNEESRGNGELRYLRQASEGVPGWAQKPDMPHESLLLQMAAWRP